jgi:capsular exopolysaccharide synthesis family protein
MENNQNRGILIPANHISDLPRFPAEDYGASEDKINLFLYLNTLMKRKWWVLGFFLAVVTIVSVATLLMTPIYRASTVLQVTQDNPGSILGDRDAFAALFASETQGRFYETQFMILNSRPMAYKIMETLNLMEHPEYKKFSEKYSDNSPEEIKSKFASHLLTDLEVIPLKRSFLVEVAFKSPDEQLAQKVVNVISTEYMKLAMETRRQSYGLIKTWLEGELQTLANRVEDSEKKIYEYGKEKDFLALDEKNNTIVKKYLEISTLLTRGQSDRMVKEAQYNQIKENGNDAPLITNNPLILRLREDLIGQQAKVSSMGKIYGANYPQLQIERTRLTELNSRLNAEIQRISKSIEADYNTARKTERLLQEAQDSQKGKVGDLQYNLVRHHILKRDMQANEQLYQGLLSRMKEASVASTMVASNVAVLTPAEYPFKPYRPRKLFNLLLACLIGAGGGVGLAFLVEYFDNSIKSIEEMERTWQLPTLGLIPLIAKSRDDHVTGENKKLGLNVLDIYNHPRSILTEALRQIRTSVMLSSSGSPPTSIMVCSPSPNEGKTTLAVAMSASLAMDGRKVVLLDADLRKPNIHKMLSVPGQPGLSNFLTGSATLEEIIKPTEIPNLFLIPAGPVPPSPTELLTSKDFEDFLQMLRRDFQHIILDTPPIIQFADGRALSSVVDGVLMIIRHNFTTRGSGLLAKQLLCQVNARIIGVIMNMAISTRLGYGPYYGYYNHYSKYYQSGYETAELDHHKNQFPK